MLSSFVSINDTRAGNISIELELTCYSVLYLYFLLMDLTVSAIILENAVTDFKQLQAS